MKHIVSLLSLIFLFSISAFGQVPEPIVVGDTGIIVGGAGFLKFAGGDPNKIRKIRVIDERQMASFAWDTTTLRLWQYDRNRTVGKRWKLSQFVQYSNGVPNSGSRDTSYKFVIDTFNRVGYICNQSGCVAIGSGSSVTASNGLTLAAGDVKLGGTLTQTAIIVTDATNRLQVRGLQSSVAGDSVVMVDNLTGTLKRKNALDFGAAISANSIDSVYLKEGGVSASDLSKTAIDTVTTLVPNVAYLKTLKRANGAVVNTQGFYSPNDGGGGRYVVQTTGTADDKTTFLMADGKYAKLQTNADNGINLLQLGAKLSDGIDDKPYIQTAIDSFNYVYCQQVGDLSVHSHFQIKSGLHLKFGNNTTLKTDGTTSDVFIVSNNVAIDSNVVIEGGIWDRVNGSTATGNIGNIYGKPSIYLYGLTFRKIKRLTIRDMKVINVPKFAISIADFEDITIDNVVFNTNSDGIHLMGAGKHVLINNIYGHTGDDFIAVSGSDYSSNNDTKGDIEDVTITNIHPTKSHGNAISLFPGNNGSRNLVFKNITINDVKGDVTTANVIRVYSDGNAAETTGGVIDGLTISDVSAKTVDGNFIFTSSIDTVKNIKLTNFHPQVGRNPIKFVSGYFDNVTIDGVYNNKMTEAAIIIDSIAKIDNLLLNDIKLTNTNALNIPFIAIDTSLYKKMDLTLTNSSFKSTTANTGYLQFSRDSANYKLNNVSFEKGLWGVRIVGKGNKLHLDNVDFSKQSTYGVASFNAGTTVDLYTRSFVPPPNYSYSFNQNSPSRMIHKEYKTIVFDSTATDRGFTSDLLEGTIFDLKNIATSPILMYGDLTINGASTYSQPAGTTVRYRKVSATNWVTETDFNTFSNASRWSKTGDAGTNSATNFIGTTDNVNFIAKVNNGEVFRLNQSDSTFSTLKDVLINSVKVGTGLGSIVTNTAVGNNALITNTTGTDNTAIGRFSLRLNTTGSGNVGLGSTTLSANTTGGSNLAIGSAILSQNTTGSRNIGIGSATLDNNTTGSDNVAIGSQALINNLTTSESIGIGTSALQNSVNTRNTAIGYSSLFSTTSGSSNVAIGHFAGYSNTTGLGNIFIGRSSDATAGTYSNSIVIGHQANITASNQIVLGNASTSEIKLNGIPNGSFSDSVGTIASGGILRRMSMKEIVQYGRGAYVDVFADFTVLDDNYVLAVANQSANITITLPTANTSTKREIVIKRQFAAGAAASTGTVTISCTPTTTSQAGNIERLDGTFGTTTTLEAAGTYGSSVRFYSNGTEWIRL